jgi:hypothetical protein
MDYRSTHVFSMKKADNCANFEAGGIINRRTHSSLCRDKNKSTGDQLCDGLQGNESRDATSNARALPTPTLFAKSKQKLLSEYSSYFQRLTGHA